jgi:peptide/nickel transport system substrate-binding protein
MQKYEELQRLLSEGRIGRREFIKRVTALCMAAAIPSALLAGEARASSPKRGGKFRQAVRGGSASNVLAGPAISDTHAANTSLQVRNRLTIVTPDWEVVGELAESWEPSDDAAQWVFKLRKGVEFHNGKTLDAEDVVHSINVHRGPKAKSVASGFVKAIEDVKSDGKDTVIFTLESGNADFPFVLTDFHFPIAIAGTEGAEWDKGIGTGPFILTDWEPGVRSASKRNPNYFKEGMPYFDEVETLNIADASTRANALQTGEVDVMEDPDLKTLHLLEQKEGLVVREVAGTKHYTFPMRMDLAPFDNLDVRSALKFAVDRKALLSSVLRGHGYLGNDHPIAKNQRFFASELPQREYDPEKAKFHVKQAGLSELTVTVSAADIFVGGVDAAVLYKEHAAKAGINIEVERVPADGYWSEVWNVVPFCVSYWQGRPTEDLMFSMAFSSESSWNETHWKHERFEKLLVEARAELDNAKRREMYVEMQRLVRDEGGLVCPIFANLVLVTSDKVQMPDELAGNWALDGNKNTERWWFA